MVVGRFLLLIVLVALAVGEIPGLLPAAWAGHASSVTTVAAGSGGLAENSGGMKYLPAPEEGALPRDVAGTVYAEPVARLQEVGVLTGDEEGLFRPENPLTRAEVSAVLVRLRGYTREEVVAAAAGPSRFVDVPLDHWAAGYINLMDGLGVVRGYDDGTFRPGAPVKRAEILTMLLRLLGYGEGVRGQWPHGVMAEAARVGLTTDPLPAADEPVTRGEAAWLLYRAAYTVPLAPGLDAAGRRPVEAWLGR